MNGDEQLLNGRVYGHDHDDPNPGPLPHRTYAELVGGPLGGLLLDIHGWRKVEVDDGVALSTELGQFPGGRALYDPRPRRGAHTGPGVSCRLLALFTSTGFWHRSWGAVAVGNRGVRLQGSGWRETACALPPDGRK